MGVIIGMDPHKSSATIEVVDERAVVLSKGRFGTDRAGLCALLAAGRAIDDRVWAVEGCNGIGQAHRAPPGARRRNRYRRAGEAIRPGAGVRDRQRPQDRPGRCAFGGLAALRAPGLAQVVVDDDLLVMGMLADRREELGRARTQTVNRLHRLLLDLFPGGAKQSLSSHQARALVSTIKPRDLVGKTRRRLVVELIVELEAIDKKMKTLKKELTELVDRPRINPARPAQHRPRRCCPAPR